MVRYHNRFLQVERHSVYAPARSHVTICEWPDGHLAVEYRGQAVTWKELTGPPIVVVTPAATPKPRAVPLLPGYIRPSMDHLWRRRDEERDIPIWQARDR